MKFKKLAMVTALAAVAGLAGVSRATTVTSEVLTSGDIVGNWRISFPVGIALIYDGGLSSAPNLVLEKSAAFDSSEGLDITFTQVSSSAAPTITITDEAVTNISGTSWSGFQFLLATDTGGTPAVFSGTAFNDTTPPFSTQTDSSNAVTLTGGTLGNTDTANWGFGPTGGALTIDASPGTVSSPKVFELKEIPIVTVVPAPAAAWTGLSGLVGLGLIAGAKRIKRLVA
ncbi:MAG TPA: hypothetical protein VMD30_06965 [Tepidisphaeraceae bacterium]|nr:hypothetical protein [Tepidisphaeraceae bacterium]